MMIKVTLLGDSIRMLGYGTKVPELLGDEFVVYQPEDNCRFSKYTLRGVLDEWSYDMVGSDVIHWNNGLWDTCDLGDGALTTPEEYVANMLRIATILKKRARTVIFATTTPVADDNPRNSNERIRQYNNLIVPKLKDMGIIINDLHTIVANNIDAYIRKDDKIHLTEAGIDACAIKVVQTIKEAVKR